MLKIIGIIVIKTGRFQFANAASLMPIAEFTISLRLAIHILALDHGQVIHYSELHSVVNFLIGF